MVSLLEDRRRILLNTPHVEEVSDSIASFETDVPANLKKCIVDIDPIQDLHGYDYPWPPGGGKNLFNIADIQPFNENVIITKTSDTFSVTNNNNYVINPFRETGKDIEWNLPPGQYTISIGNVVSSNLAVYASSDGISYSWFDNGISAGYLSKTFTVSAEKPFITIRGTIRANESMTISKFQLESGSTATSYSPYSNLCPISGWDEVDVWDDPKYGGLVEWNQYAKPINSTEWRAGGAATVMFDDGEAIATNLTATWQGINQATRISRVQNHKYLLSAYARTVDENTTVSIGTGFLTPVTTIGTVSSTTNTRIATIIQNTGDSGLPVLNIGNRHGTASFAVSKIQVFDLTQMFGEGNEPTIEQFDAFFPNDYYPYNAGETMTVGQVNGEAYRHYTIEMPTSAGTVYGGTFDMLSGVLTVDRAIVKISDLSWNYDTNWLRFNGNGIEEVCKKPESNSVTLPGLASSVYKASSAASTGSLAINGTIGVLVSGGVCIRDESYSNVEEWLNFVGNEPIVYPLANPITYQLDPHTLKAIRGTNNIWSDAGDTTVRFWTH